MKYFGPKLHIWLSKIWFLEKVALDKDPLYILSTATTTTGYQENLHSVRKELKVERALMPKVDIRNFVSSAGSLRVHSRTFDPIAFRFPNFNTPIP